MTITRIARYAYVAFVWAFGVALLVQTLLAGLAIFGDPRDIEAHRLFGYLLHLSPIGILIAAAVARLDRSTLILVAALVGVTLVQPLLPMLADTSAALAALHPVLALVMFAIAARLAWTSLALLPGRSASGPEGAH